MRGDAYQTQGQQGGRTVSAGETATANYRWILVVTPTVLASIASNITGADTALVGITLPAGFGFGGAITSIGVTSGVVIAYGG